MKKLILLFVILFTVSFVYGQTCINNPSIQGGDVNPAPLTPGAGGTLTFTFVENLTDYDGFLTDPVSITVCLLNVEPVNGASSVSGSFAPNFNWVYDPGSNCLQGVQNTTLFGGFGGPIVVAFNQTNPVQCPSNQMGFNANLQPAACMNGINETVDDTESVYTCTDILLPLNISTFTGLVANCQGIISWTTASEPDLSHFELEKSTDGVTFNSIETFLPKGNGSEGAKYSYTDKALRDINLYRLRSVDNDGTIAYGKLIQLEKECGIKDGDYDIYPNPVFTDNLNIQMESNHINNDAILVISDVLGRVVSTHNTAISEGTNFIKVDVSHLSAATYFVSFRNDTNLTDSKKFVKVTQ